MMNTVKFANSVPASTFPGFTLFPARAEPAPNTGSENAAARAERLYIAGFIHKITAYFIFYRI